METSITIALAGNPNSGKTTIFNNFTNARQKIANYPGVTVEKKEGICLHKGKRIKVVDLPGTYGLTAYSEEELIARNFIINEPPDVLIDIIDASNIERNLYLTTQFIELGVPLVIALNMSDVAERRGIKFDIEKLSALLGAPVILTVGTKNTGLEELLDAALKVASNPKAYPSPHISYGGEIEEELVKIGAIIENSGINLGKYSPRWLAVKLLEYDSEVLEKVNSSDVIDAVEKSSRHLHGIFKEDPEIIIAERRYGFISGVCTEAVKSTVESRHSKSDKLDELLMSPIFGLPIFLGLMYLTFFLTFKLGNYPMEWIETAFSYLGRFISGLWEEGSTSFLKSLLVDGIVGGVGGVIVFLPNILLLFFAIAFLEDTGYMARAAFIMDKIMHKIGLHGKSFVPMLLGFGCSIPAIMATRTLDTRRDKLITILVIPLMSCGGRLPIYALIIPAFFHARLQAPILLLIYLIGIVLAVISAKVLSRTLFRSESPYFVMELPPYRMPTLRSMFIHMWERGWLYLRKAGTLILGISILMWALTTFPSKESLSKSENLEYSFAGRIGRGIEPLLKTMGFDWRIGTALIGATAAKEVFVAQIGIVYSVEHADGEPATLRERLLENYSPLTAFCIMLFSLIGFPCMATVAVTIKESGSWKWGLFQFGGLTFLAWLITTIVYQSGNLINWFTSV